MSLGLAAADPGFHVQALEQHEPKYIIVVIKSGSFALRLSLWLRFKKCLGESHKTWFNRHQADLVTGLKQGSWS